MAPDEEISEDCFRKLLSVFSKFYDDFKCINLLKVLYSDHIKSRSKLSEANSALVLLNLLKLYGSLGRKNLTILYDTIKVTEHFGLEEEIEEQVPTCRCPDLKEIVITKFSAHRQKLIKLGNVLTLEDVKNISGLYDVSGKEYKDSWSLIMDLELRKIICDSVEKMEKFTKDMNTLKIMWAVECLKEDIPNTPSSSRSESDRVDLCVTVNVSVRVNNRKRTRQNTEYKDVPGQQNTFTILEDTVAKEKEKRVKAQDIFEIIEPLVKCLKTCCVEITEVSSGSLVLHVSVSDPYALENLYNICLTGELIQELAELLVPPELQEEFMNIWSTDIDEEEYVVALNRLKAKGYCEHNDVCIISDDADWERMLMEKVKQKRPSVNCSIMKRWRHGKPEIVNDLIGQSKNVIVGFSPKPLADYSKYAAHSVVVEMLKAKKLDDGKIIPLKISEDAVVPPEFESFATCQVWDELFVDRLLQDKFEPVIEISEGKTDASIDKFPGTDVKDSTEVQSDSYDFCFISDNSEWENKLMDELQERMPDIKCTSMQDFSDLNKDNLIIKIQKSKKVILGFSTLAVTVQPKSAANVVEEMLEGCTLHHAKLIPVKISEDAFVPPDFKLFTVVNGWGKQFVEYLEEIYAKSMKTYTDSSYEPQDQNMKRVDSETSLSSFSSGYSSAGTDMTSESAESEDNSSSGYSSENDTASESTDPKPEFDETENFKIIKSLVIELGTQKMTEEFFKAFLKNERDKGSFEQMKDLKLKHKIYSPDADFITFDISIIMTFIRFCCGFTYLDEDWEQPDRIDNPVLSNLIRIQQYKNILDQNTRRRISTNEFEEEWNGIKEVLLNLGVPSTDIDAMKLRTGLNTVYLEEIQNFQSIMSLVLELGTEALRKYVLEVNNIQEKDVGQFLMNEKDNLLKTAKLLPEQKKKMFSKKADIRSFDIPIMMNIIRHCNQLPDSFWSEPDEEYINKLANLVRIHRYANTKLAHRANARMSNKEFKIEWKNLTTILQGVGISIEKIDKYKPLHLTASTS